MDLFENNYDSNSSKTIIVWENDKSLFKSNTTTKNIYKVPRGLSDNYLLMITRMANNLVNHVIEDSQWVVQSSLLEHKSNPVVQSDEDSENEILNKHFIQSYKDKLLIHTSDSDYSLLSKSDWLSENGTLDNYAATMKILDYIKQNWDLDEKYLFTVEMMSTVSGSNYHCYKAEFSVPTNEHPIPQITVSAFFAVQIPSLLSLPVYVKYRLETDVRVYVVGRDAFNKNRFEHLFEIKRNAYADINRYHGWSSRPNRSCRF